MTLTEYLRDSKILELSRQLGLEGRIHEVYWTVFPLLIDDDYHASIGEASADFHLSTPAERYNLRESDFLGERAILEHVLDRVRPSDVFYDIGAQFGAYSCLVSDLLVEGTVVAFEPDPHRVTRIETNFERNGVDGCVLTCALSDVRGERGFKLSTGELTQNEGVTVETTTIDHLLSEERIPPSSVVKIDVEGSELEVLKGMKKTLVESSPGHIYCEMHEPVEVDHVRDFLEDYGYAVQELHSHSTFLYATDQATTTSEGHD